MTTFYGKYSKKTAYDNGDGDDGDDGGDDDDDDDGDGDDGELAHCWRPPRGGKRAQRDNCP